MDLVILANGESSIIKAEGLTIPKRLVKIDDEYLVERIVRIAYECGINKVHCIINSNEPELKNFLLSRISHQPINLLVNNNESFVHSLLALSPFLSGKPFCLVTNVSVFSREEFSQFIDYSKMQEDADGILAVTKYLDDEKPLCVAMDEEDTILKFSDSREGYNWATGGIYYFSPKILDEMEYALEKGVYQLRPYLKHIVANNYLLKGYVFT